MKTLDEEILAVQRMARYSRFLARAARTVAAEFRPSLEDTLALGVRSPPGTDALLQDLRSLSLDRETEARNHDREAGELEAIVRRLEEMRAVLQSFRIDPPDADGDVWLWMEHQGSGRQAGFNLGKPSGGRPGDDVRLFHNVAAILETARQSAVGDRP